MEFRFNVNEIFNQPIAEISHTLIPAGFKGDRRQLWDSVSKVTDIVNAMGTASANAQSLTKPITTADRLRNSEQQVLYLMIDPSSNQGKGAVTGMLKTGRKGLYVFDRDGHHFQVQAPCVLDFYVHESRQRCGYGKKLFEHMLQREEVIPKKLAIDRPSDKFLAFLNKHYMLNNPIRQMNNFVVYDGFFPKDEDKKQNGDSQHRGSNGLQAQILTSPYGRYGARRPPCSMGQIIHNQSSSVTGNEQSGSTTIKEKLIPQPSNNSEQPQHVQQPQTTVSAVPAVSPTPNNVNTNVDNTKLPATSIPLKKAVTNGLPTVSDEERLESLRIEEPAIVNDPKKEFHWPFAVAQQDYVYDKGFNHNSVPATKNGIHLLLQPEQYTLEKQKVPAKEEVDRYGKPINKNTNNMRNQLYYQTPQHHNVQHGTTTSQFNVPGGEGSFNNVTSYNYFAQRPMNRDYFAPIYVDEQNNMQTQHNYHQHQPHQHHQQQQQSYQHPHHHQQQQQQLLYQQQPAGYQQQPIYQQEQQYLDQLQQAQYAHDLQQQQAWEQWMEQNYKMQCYDNYYQQQLAQHYAQQQQQAQEQAAQLQEAQLQQQQQKQQVQEQQHVQVPVEQTQQPAEPEKEQKEAPEKIEPAAKPEVEKLLPQEASSSLLAPQMKIQDQRQTQRHPIPIKQKELVPSTSPPMPYTSMMYPPGLTPSNTNQPMYHQQPTTTMPPMTYSATSVPKPVQSIHEVPKPEAHAMPQMTAPAHVTPVSSLHPIPQPTTYAPLAPEQIAQLTPQQQLMYYQQMLSRPNYSQHAFNPVFGIPPQPQTIPQQQSTTPQQQITTTQPTQSQQQQITTIEKAEIKNEEAPRGDAEGDANKVCPPPEKPPVPSPRPLLRKSDLEPLQPSIPLRRHCKPEKEQIKNKSYRTSTQSRISAGRFGGLTVRIPTQNNSAMCSPIMGNSTPNKEKRNITSGRPRSVNPLMQPLSRILNRATSAKSTCGMQNLKNNSSPSQTQLLDKNELLRKHSAIISQFLDKLQ